MRGPSLSLSIKRALVLYTILLLIHSGCSTPSPTRASEARKVQPSGRPYVEILQGSFAEVLAGFQRIAAIYSLKESKVNETNKTAFFQTEIKMGQSHNPQLFEYPTPSPFYESIRYSMTFRLREGQRKGKVATRVEIEKLIEVRDSFKGWTFRESDGLEERILLNQIQEEVFNRYAYERFQAKTKPLDLQEETDSEESESSPETPTE